MPATVTAVPRTVSGLFLAFSRTLVREIGPRLWFAVALLILIGLLEGSGLLMLVPLLHALGLGGGGAVQGLAGSAVRLFRGPGSISALAATLAIFVAIKVAQAALRAWSGTLNLKIETEFVCFLRDRFYRAMMQANWLFLMRTRSSDLTQALLVEIPWSGAATQQLLTLLSVAAVTLVQVGIARSLSPAMAAVALGLFVYFAVRIEHVDTARLLVLVFVFTRLLSHFTTLQNLWHQIVQALPSFSANEELRERLIAAAEPPVPASLHPLVLHQALRVEAVTFRYQPAQPAAALQRLDLVIPARQVTALCGPSGAGKSTLADLLLGLLAPTSGRVLIDGEPLAGPRLHAWRQSVGYVPQETFLFHESVRANLLWAQPGADERELRAALRAAAAEEFVDRLPHGLDTVVGDRGVRLSGGERQRIALARALLRRPTLLVLDEATSALDTPNERLVQDAIDRLQGELTIVLIAHRLSTVRRADRIVVLEAGTVVESGTWDELNGREHGAFRRLVAASAET